MNFGGKDQASSAPATEKWQLGGVLEMVLGLGGKGDDRIGLQFWLDGA